MVGLQTYLVKMQQVLTKQLDACNCSTGEGLLVRKDESLGRSMENGGEKAFLGGKLERRGTPRSPPWGASSESGKYGSSLDPYSPPGFLPEHLESELDLPRAIGAENLAEVRAGERIGRISKIRVVEQIEEF